MLKVPQTQGDTLPLSRSSHTVCAEAYVLLHMPMILHVQLTALILSCFDI